MNPTFGERLGPEGVGVPPLPAGSGEVVPSRPGEAAPEIETASPGAAEPAQGADLGPPTEARDAAELRDRWLRAEAELQNYRRRAQRDLDEAERSAEERVMLEMIHALDDLDRALEAARGSKAPEAWLHGVRLVADRMKEYLARQGVVTLHPVGEPFDPAFHEALLEMDAPEGVAPGHVVQVVLTGYRRGARALRAARVVVARRPTGAPAE